MNWRCAIAAGSLLFTGCSGASEDATPGPTTGSPAGAAGQAGAAGASGTGGGAGQAGQAGGGASGACPSVQAVTLSEEDAPLSLAIDATHVYWAAAIPQSGGTFAHEVRRAAKTGGAAETIAQATGEVGSVALTADDVVWIDVPQSGAAKLQRTPKAGGSSVTVATLGASYGRVDRFSLGVDGGAVMFLAMKPTATDFSYSLWRASLSNGALAKVASHTLPVGIDSRLMLLDVGEAIWAFQSGWIYRASTTQSGSPDATLVLDEELGVDAMAMQGGDLVVASEGELSRVAKTGGAKMVIDASAEAYRALAVTSDWLVWGARDHAGAETIRGRRGDGKVCTLVASGVQSAYSTAVDQKRVYWTNTATKPFGGAIKYVDLP